MKKQNVSLRIIYKQFLFEMVINGFEFGISEMFECKRCGLCCKNIKNIPELKDYHNGDGVCVHLTHDNLCEIYNNRPDICDVNKMFEIKYHNIMTRDEYDRLNGYGCKVLKSNSI